MLAMLFVRHGTRMEITTFFEKNDMKKVKNNGVKIAKYEKNKTNMSEWTENKDTIS